MLQGGGGEQLTAGALVAEREKQVQQAGRTTGLLAELRGGRYIDLSKDTQFSDAWIVFSALLTLVGLAAANRFLLAAAATMFVVVGVGWAWNELSLFGIHYRRRFSETRAFLGEEVALTLELRNRKLLPVTWLRARDIFPAGLSMVEEQVRINELTHQGEFISFWSLGAFERSTRHFTVRCTKRGYHPYGPVRLQTGDAFGMFASEATLADRQYLIVYPRLYSAAELRLPAKNPFGMQSSKELFEDPLRTAGIRDWQPGDSPRRVHWKATARHARLLSRLYEPSEEPQVLVFLNVATMARHWLGNYPELQERAISVAGSLAALCTEQRLPVGLVANGYLPESDQVLRLLPGRSPNQLLRILEMLAAVTPFAARPIEELLLREAPRLPWGATLLVVTAVAHEGLLVVMQDLAHAGRRLALFTLAEQPPARSLPGITVYHLPHLVDDIIVPLAVE